MTRAGKVLAWVGGGIIVLALLAVGLVVAVARSDWAREQVAARASEALGRKVTLADLDVDFGRLTRIRLAGITIGNPDWARQPEMARLEALELAVRVWPLLTGTLELDDVRLVRPDVALEKHPDGRANWHFARKTPADPAPEHRGEFPVIHHLAIADGHLLFQDPANRITIDSRIATATGGDPANRKVTLEGHGAIGGQPTRIDLEAGSLLSLREGEQPYPLKLEVNIGETRLRAAGTIAEPVKMAGLDLTLLATGPDLSALTPVTGVPLPTTQAYRIEGTLLRQGASWTVRDFHGQVGASDLAGGATLVTGGERPTFRANLVSDRLALADLAGLIGGAPGEEDVTKAPDRVLPARPLALDQLKTIDMNVRFTGKRVEAPGLPIDGLDAQVVIEDGLARIEPLSFALAQGALAGSVVLDARPQVPTATIDLALSRVDLKRLFGQSRFADESSGTLAGKIELAGRGRSTADLLAGADGRVTLVMADGRLSNLLMEAAGLDAAEALGFLLTKDQPVAVRCLVADFAVENGLASSRALVLDTTDTVVTGQGRIDLGSEAMNIRFEAHPKDASLLSARTPVTIGGTLGKPKVGIEAGEAAAKGGLAAALGVLLTPLAAIIPFLEPGLGEDQPCGELIQQANASSPAPARPAAGQ